MAVDYNPRGWWFSFNFVVRCQRVPGQDTEYWCLKVQRRCLAVLNNFPKGTNQDQLLFLLQFYHTAMTQLACRKPALRLVYRQINVTYHQVMTLYSYYVLFIPFYLQTLTFEGVQAVRTYEKA